MWRDQVTPEVKILASEVFDRTWQFLERDPVLSGEDPRTASRTIR